MSSSSSFDSRSAIRRSISPVQWLADLPIRTKLIVAFAIVLLLALIIVGYFSDAAVSSQLRASIGTQFKDWASSRAESISEWLAQQTDELSALGFVFRDALVEANGQYNDDADAAAQIAQRASRWEQGKADPSLLALDSNFSQQLQDYVDESDQVIEIFVTDRYGTLVAQSRPVAQYSYAADDWWQAVWNGGQGAIFVGAPEQGGTNKTLVIPIAVPVLDRKSNSVVGVIHGLYRLDKLYELANSARMGETGRALWIFPGAQVLANPNQLQPLDQTTRDALAVVVNQDYAEINVQGKPSLTSQAAITLPGATAAEWRLVVIQDLDESLELINAARLSPLLTGLSLIIVAIVLAYGLSLIIMRPMRRLTQAVQEFGAGDYTKRASANRADEIGQLALVFNEMADAIQTREIELQQWSSTLDRLVKDRTTELMQANESLQQEIAERKRVQLEVLLERIRLEALIESSYDGLILINTENEIQVINAMALKLLDLPGIPHDWLNYEIGNLQEAVNGTPLEGLKHLKEINASRKSDESAAQGEYEIEGQVVTWMSLPVQTSEVPFGRLLVLHDETKNRLLERLRDDLIHTMVHDLRNPLGTITVALELFHDDPLTADQRQMMGIVRDSTIRMTNIVNAILDIGRLESGSMPLDRKQVSFAGIASEIMNLQQPLAQQKKIKLNQRIPEDLPLIDADRELIGRVVQNLVGNAIKFTPKKGTISLSAKPDGTMLEVTVKDTGSGIAPDVRDRLFMKFATGKQKGRGSGLGLSFSRLAVEAHGGRIWLESTGKEGTSFKFTLPLAGVDEKTDKDKSKEGESEQTPSS